MPAPYFIVPFATGGDQLPDGVPVALQPDGSVSYTLGWGTDYELDDTQPGYKPVGRREMNSMFNAVTWAVGEIQQHGFPLWREAAAPYPINAVVRSGDVVWRSTANNNSTTPGTEGANWVNVNAALPDASTTTKGLVALATTAEVVAGTNGTKAVTPETLAPAVASLTKRQGLQGGASNWKAYANGTSANIVCSANGVIVGDASGNVVATGALALTLNTAATASATVDGMASGPTVANTWYGIYVWTNAAGVKRVTGDSAYTTGSAPTPPAAGFDSWARRGAFRTDGTASKFPLAFIQAGSAVNYAPSPSSNVPFWPIMASGAAGVLNGSVYAPVAVAVAAFIPPTASRITGRVNASTNVLSVYAVSGEAGTYTAAPGVNPPQFGGYGYNQTALWTAPFDILLKGTSIFWASTDTGAYLRCFGWEDEL